MTRPAKKTRAARARTEVADVAAEISALEQMTTAELAERYAEVFGETTRSRNKAYLKKKVAWRIQEIAEGGLSPRARKRADELAEDAPIRRRGLPATTVAADADADAPAGKQRDPRLPAAGETLTKTHRGVDHEVLVLNDAFEYRGERYTSLSKVAKVITGTTWNGFLFFGLAKRKPARKAAR